MGSTWRVMIHSAEQLAGNSRERGKEQDVSFPMGPSLLTSTEHAKRWVHSGISGLFICVDVDDQFAYFIGGGCSLYLT